jgi:hypothetical protein
MMTAGEAMSRPYRGATQTRALDGSGDCELMATRQLRRTKLLAQSRCAQ